MFKRLASSLGFHMHILHCMGIIDSARDAGGSNLLQWSQAFAELLFEESLALLDRRATGFNYNH